VVEAAEVEVSMGPAIGLWKGQNCQY
jgi:hypothetical protein